MSKTGIIIVAILVTLGLTYGLSLLLTRRKTKTGGSVSADDWEVGGRELPLYVVVGTQFATAMGGGILVGQVGNGFNNGLSCLLYGILCQLAFIVLMFIAKWLRSHQFATVPDISADFLDPFQDYLDAQQDDADFNFFTGAIGGQIRTKRNQTLPEGYEPRNTRQNYWKITQITGQRTGELVCGIAEADEIELSAKLNTVSTNFAKLVDSGEKALGRRQGIAPVRKKPAAGKER